MVCTLCGRDIPLETVRLPEDYAYLKKRYEEVVSLNERLIERYTKDYKKWAELKAWVFDGQPSGKRKITPQVLKRRKVVREINQDAGQEDEDERRDIGRVLGVRIPSPLVIPTRGQIPRRGVAQMNKTRHQRATSSPRSSGPRIPPSKDASCEKENVPCPSQDSQPPTMPQPSQGGCSVRSSQTEEESQPPAPFRLSLSQPNSQSHSQKRKTIAGGDPHTKVAKRVRLDENRFLNAEDAVKRDVNREGPQTINALYTIDSTRNDGVTHQFQEVVRGKQKRKHLQAEDCDCCRSYYEAVGDLPPRLQPPPWRSPSPDDSTSSQKIQKHKQAISRHRHHWTRPLTPPGYWNIGFPDTQEVDKINTEAREMHKSKLERIGEDLRRGDGRWRRKS